jgi:CDP-L-myo-inositol myo-inositolphosphotransferase
MGKHDGPVSRYINRRISGRITGFIVSRNIPITPNQVSLITFALSLLAAYIIAVGHLIVGGLLVQLSSILEGVDGELARARGMASSRGGFLDTMLDRYADISVILATIYVLASNSPLDTVTVLISALALTGDLMVSYIHARGVLDLGVHPASIGPLDSAASRDVRLLLLAILLIIGQPLGALAVLAVLTHVYVIVKFLYLLSYTGK